MEDRLLRLYKLNFNDLIEIECDDLSAYGLDVYRKNGDRHRLKNRFCTFCEEKGGIREEGEYALRNISHGTHAREFIEWMGIADISGWNDGAVMFVMENPSRYDLYENHTKGAVTKRPARKWYWLDGNDNEGSCPPEQLGYPNCFAGSQYGSLVASVIRTFRLKNAYMTNMVKCGINTPDGKSFKKLSDFSQAEAVRENCYERFLKKEIDIMRPKVIFAFGASVRDFLMKKCGSDIITALPHPARQQSGFSDEYYKVLDFCMTAVALRRAGVITPAFYAEKMEEFYTGYYDVQKKR